MNNQVKSTWTVGVKALLEQILHSPITNNEPFSKANNIVSKHESINNTMLYVHWGHDYELIGQHRTHQKAFLSACQPPSGNTRLGFFQKQRERRSQNLQDKRLFQDKESSRANTCLLYPWERNQLDVQESEQNNQLRWCCKCNPKVKKKCQLTCSLIIM